MPQPGDENKTRKENSKKKITVFVREKRADVSRIGSKKRDEKGPKYWMEHTVLSL